MLKNSRYYINLLVIFFSAIPSGMFFILSGSTLAFYLKDQQFDNISIALFSLANFLHIFKFLWGPLLERVVFRSNSSHLGFKIILTSSLFGCIICLYFLSILSPSEELVSFCLILILFSFFAASYEILIQASQILLIDQQEWGISEACCITGFRVGILIAGSLALYLSSFLNWADVYKIMNYICVIILLVITFYPFRFAINIEHRVEDLDFKTPFLLLWQQPHKLALIFFLLTYRLQDHILGKMPNMYLIDVGFSKISIALIYKAYGLIALLLGGFVGGYLCKNINFKPLFIAMLIIHALSGLLFTIFADGCNNIMLLYFVIICYEFTKGLMITPFFSYQLRCCEPNYAIPQIALITSIVELSRILFGAAAGYLATQFGWINFFILASLSGLVCLSCINYLPNLNNKRNTLGLM